MRWSLPRALPILLLSTGVVALHIAIPLHVASTTLPISVLGTAVAFYLGFKNSQAYDRFWEARRVWGEIVNTSRTFAVGILDAVRGTDGEDASVDELKAAHRDLLLRQIAWAHALRLALRPDPPGTRSELEGLLAPDELELAMRHPSVPAYLLRFQSLRIETLVERGVIRGTARHLDLRNSIRALYDQQGACERIKGTPLVPQYTAAATMLVWIYIFLFPFSLLNALEGEIVWAVVPVSTLIGWIYDTMDRIGRFTENPFDGLPTDVPMTSICRTIERDLRAMLGERDLPPPIEPRDHVLQ